MDWNRKSVRVVCLQTCAIYESCTKAAAAAGVNASSIIRAVKSGKPCRGRYYAALPAGIQEEDAGALRAWCTVEMLRRVGAV